LYPLWRRAKEKTRKLALHNRSMCKRGYHIGLKSRGGEGGKKPRIWSSKARDGGITQSEGFKKWRKGGRKGGGPMNQESKSNGTPPPRRRGGVFRFSGKKRGGFVPRRMGYYRQKVHQIPQKCLPTKGEKEKRKNRGYPLFSVFKEGVDKQVCE